MGCCVSVQPSLPTILKRAQQVLAARSPPVLTDAQRGARAIHLREFVKRAWPLIEPSTPLVWNYHLDALCDHLEALLTGQLGKQNLFIAVPPGSMKSTIVSVCVPAWMWIREPSWRATFAITQATDVEHVLELRRRHGIND